MALLDEGYGVPVYRPTDWALTTYPVPTGPDVGRWKPCITLWLPPAQLAALRTQVGLPSADGTAAVPGAVEPLEYRVLTDGTYRVGAEPPPIRCYLPAWVEDADENGDVAAAVDVPAAAAFTAALANHDDPLWNLPLFLAPGPARRPTAPLALAADTVALAIDLTPLAEDTEGEPAFPASLLGGPLLAAEAAEHGPELPGAGAVGSAHASLWVLVSGLTLGHRVSARRLLDAAGMLGNLEELLDLEGSGPQSPAELLDLLTTAQEENPAIGTLLAMLTAAAGWASATHGALAQAGVPDPVAPELARMQELAAAGGPAAGVAASGVLQSLDAETWQLFAGAGVPGPEVLLTHGPQRVLPVMVAQAAVRAAVLFDNPTRYLAGVSSPPGMDPAWPLLVLGSDLAAHDTVVLRALLGAAADEPFDPGYLSGLLHNLQGLLDEVPSAVAAVREDLAGRTAGPGRDGAAALLERLLAVEDPCVVLDDEPYPALADHVCALLPAVIDALAAAESSDIGGPAWVRARDVAVHELLHPQLEE